MVMGQYYLRARYYNPVIGRFTQEDTYYGDGLNLYAYCANNPVGYEDPSGHQVCPTQKAVYSKYRKQGMSKKEAYEAMKKELGIERKSGYKDSGTSPDFGKKDGKHSLSNVEARKWYLEQEAKIPDMIDKSLPLKEQAKQAFNLRNKFRTQARELMADRAAAESLYKTDPNLTWKEIVKKQRKKG